MLLKTSTLKHKLFIIKITFFLSFKNMNNNIKSLFLKRYSIFLKIFQKDIILTYHTINLHILRDKIKFKILI